MEFYADSRSANVLGAKSTRSTIRSRPPSAEKLRDIPQLVLYLYCIGRYLGRSEDVFRRATKSSAAEWLR